ncbi:MAG: phosphoribosylamine--glycine ligase, partial [bacterium]
MKVLVIGNGGREHAMALRLHQSASVSEVHSTPVNEGIQTFGKCASINTGDFEAVNNYVMENEIDLVAVGPEDPLSRGIVDFFNEKKVPVFGPTGAAARIETSKGFAKDLMAKYGIPTGAYEKFDNFEMAKRYIESFKNVPVIKADGLAAGKGVILPQTRDEAVQVCNDMLSGKSFGNAGRSIVVEERLSGPEVSIFAITDGKNFKTLVPSQDHKRIFDNDKGPNTGGMGAYAPVPIVSDEFLTQVEKSIISPTIRGMAEEGCAYTGLLYAGLMITEMGPKVIEFNCRFGDPETQVVLPLLEGDFGEIIM